MASGLIVARLGPQGDSNRCFVGTAFASQREDRRPDHLRAPRVTEVDMHRPDTIIEIHRERVQDQTVAMFSGDKYTESVDGTGYSATATLDLTLDRVWFVLDAQGRLWPEEADGE